MQILSGPFRRMATLPTYYYAEVIMILFCKSMGVLGKKTDVCHVMTSFDRTRINRALLKIAFLLFPECNMPMGWYNIMTHIKGILIVIG